jgi:hypothetical protein
MRSVFHGGLTPPAPGRECERCATEAYSICKFDRNIAAYGNVPSTHAYSCVDSIRSPRGAYASRSWLRLRTLLQMCDSGRRKRCFSTGGLRPPLLAAQCRAGAPNAERSERTADIGESRIRASLIGEWICLPPVGLFACCPDSGIGASLIGEWNRLPPTGVFACCPDSGIGASLIAQWIEEPCKTSSRPTDVAF